MSEEPFEEMSLRDEVEADFPFSVSEKIQVRIGIGSQSDPIFFYSDITCNLIRFERSKAQENTTNKAGQRGSLVKLQRTARRYLAALDDLPTDIASAVDTALQAVTSDDRWDGWSFEADEPMPADDESLELSRINTENIVAACQIQLDILDETKGQSKRSSAPALDHLLVELAGLFERSTEISASTQCYRDQTSQDEYSGRFYQLVRSILDVYSPKCYGTPAGLGIRIVRALNTSDDTNT